MPLPSDPQMLTSLAVFARVLGVFIFAPLISSRFVPHSAKIALALATTVMLAPNVPLVKPTGDPLAFLCVLMFKQLAVGAAMGFVSSLIFVCAEMGGQVLDVQMGTGSAQLFDPSASEQTSILGHAHHILATMIFLALDGHHWLLEATFRSLQLVPLTGVSLTGDIFSRIFLLIWRSVEIALRIAAPGIAALFLADCALGLVARAVPQMNVFFVGIAPKILLGAIILALSAPFIVAAISTVVADMPRHLDAFLSGL